MIPARIIPVLWIRFLVIVAFLVWVTTQQQWLFVAIAAILVAITGFQIAGAYRAKREARRDA
ncbi:hypothetical membrane protein [Corynebacterium renale]|uniref:hypothetical protein n=1 Tax=Corynebacterium renale TaxID=1724 RepID=UPI000DA3C6FF|nr:hypothetical protein [Corynebacterium renale]SQG64666.1 hypothetical membrane protein [Corynebacterium renale]STC95858.1 hypothetical membrane protein [Corynebacterium renale]